MRYKIDNCYYELIKDLLLSLDSFIKNVEKDTNGAIVTLQEGKSKDEFVFILNHGPLFAFCKESKIYVL